MNRHYALIKGSQAKFIEMWRCWTPNQLPLLKGNLSNVLFLSAPSTGKTALMEAKAFQCMQNGMNVLFIIPYANVFNEPKSLLTLRMQQQWKNLKEEYQWENEFNVCALRRSGLSSGFEHLRELVQNESIRNTAIFIDELQIENNHDLRDLTDIVTMNEQRTIWLTITYIQGDF